MPLTAIGSPTHQPHLKEIIYYIFFYVPDIKYFMLIPEHELTK